MPVNILSAFKKERAALKKEQKVIKDRLKYIETRLIQLELPTDITKETSLWKMPAFPKTVYRMLEDLKPWRPYEGGGRDKSFRQFDEQRDAPTVGDLIEYVKKHSDVDFSKWHGVGTKGLAVINKLLKTK